jgi:predicted transcriptional regulator
MAPPDLDPPRRPDLYVVARFLDKLTAAPDGLTHAKLQAAVRLNYDLYRRYLALLVTKGFARVGPDKEGAERATLTPEGRHAHERLVRWIRDAFGDVRL